MITGFTAGNQPIAQAALVDISANEDEKTRNMGFVLVAESIGLVIGPILGGVLSDPSVLGSIASIELPFYAAALLVIVNIALILVFFENRHDQTRPITIKLTDVFLTLYHASQRPVVLRLSIVFFCSQLALNSFFVFVDNYLLSKFNFSTLQNSVVLVIFGITMACLRASWSGRLRAALGNLRLFPER